MSKYMTVDEQVEEFHRAFGQPVRDVPTVPPINEIQLRARLETEEHFELLEAMGFEVPAQIIDELKVVMNNGPTQPFDMIETADALADKDYISAGTRHTIGIKGAPIAAEVQRSNMAKLGPDGKPIKRADGKILKPDSWTPPDIKSELVKQGWVPPKDTK